MSLDMIIEKSGPILTDRSKKVELYSDLGQYRNENPDAVSEFVTLTFKDGKYNKFVKTYLVNRHTFKEADADDLHSTVEFFFENYVHIPYYFRLDLSSVRLRWHYHGIVFPHNPVEMKNFITLWNKTFGHADCSAVRKYDRAARYICGLPPVDENILDRDIEPLSWKYSKINIRDYLNTFIISTLYIASSASDDKDNFED